MKRKGLWISLGAIGALVVIFIILCFTLFSLSSVSINWRNKPIALAGSEQEIIESGKFGYGKSVLFSGKQNYIASLEKANSYLKVINIETVFPNRYVVHCMERQQVYAIPLNERMYICDDEFKVLEIYEDASEFVSGQDKPTLIEKGLRVENSLAEKGEFLKVANKVDLFSAFIENNQSLPDQQALIKTMEFGQRPDPNFPDDEKMTQTFVKLSLYDGQTYILLNPEKFTKQKVAKMMGVYSSIFSLVGSAIDPDQPLTEDNTWTAEKLRTSVIEINNYYVASEEHPLGDCYSRIIPPQNT